MIETNIWFWVGFVGFIVAMLALDLGVFHREARVVRPKEGAVWTAVWVGLALVFAGGLAFFSGRHSAITFLTGYVIEESMSVDNIFIMVLIFSYFAVPAKCQHRVLFYGILGALIMRGLFIGLGAVLIARFEWVLYVFGVLLVVTGVRMAIRRDKAFQGDRNPVVRLVRRLVPLARDYHGTQFFVVQDGRRLATPLLLVLVLVEFTDLLFAIDSIPATFGVTRDPFIVFTSNIFAVVGLRSLYFLLASMVDRFHLLKYALAAILVFIGAKMLGVVEIDVVRSLAIVLAILAAAVIASLVWRGPGHRAGGRIGRPGTERPESSERGA